MKKILIIGVANLQHTVNFINTLLVDDFENKVTVFNTKYEDDLVPEIGSFYSDNGINVINAQNLSQSKNGKVKAVLNLIKMERAFRKECRFSKQFDMCLYYTVVGKVLFWCRSIISFSKKWYLCISEVMF